MRERERHEAKVADLRRKAARAHQQATAPTGQLVPEHGQPILPGHHSEATHRRMMHNAYRVWDRQAEAAQEAERLRTAANALEARAARSTYSDDPDAVERLEGEIVAHEQLIERLLSGGIPALDSGARRGQVAASRRAVRALRARIEKLPRGPQTGRETT